MEPAILSAASALTGSLIGGVSTLTASWLTQRRQFRAQALVHEAVKDGLSWRALLCASSSCPGRSLAKAFNAAMSSFAQLHFSERHEH